MHLTKTERTKKHERREKSGKRRLNNKLKAVKKVRKDAVCVYQTTINEFDSKIHCLEEALKESLILSF